MNDVSSAAMAQAQASAADLVVAVGRMWRAATADLDQPGRGALGQFLTPPPVATLMAAMLGSLHGSVRLLDPGAGIGPPTVAAVAAMLTQVQPRDCVEVGAYATDATLPSYLERSLAARRGARESASTTRVLPTTACEVCREEQ